LLQVINDPIHGTFRLDPVTIDIVDSRQFQRLRRLKQLGMSYYVSPLAS
jgi:HD superfamily phosphohydrolase